MTTNLLMTPTRAINFAKIMPLLKSEQKSTLVVSRPGRQRLELTTIKRNTDLQLRSRTAPRHAPKLTQLETNTLSVPRTSGTISRAAGIADLETIGVAELRLPFGMPRFVNVATLKRMLRAKRSDVLLRREGERWEIAVDRSKVDLLDDSVEFRLGSIQIFS